MQDAGENLEDSERQRLVVIMFTDIVGYSAISSRDQGLTFGILADHQKIMRHAFRRFEGREVKGTGDGFLVEFQGATDAVRCAVEIQTALYERNASSTDDKAFKVRIGIHLGEVVRRGGDIYGDAVNVAARLEAQAPAGGICLSDEVARIVRNDVPLQDLGYAQLKNVDVPKRIHRVLLPWERGAGASRRLRTMAARLLVNPFSRRLAQSAFQSPATALLGLVALAAIVVLGIASFAVWSSIDAGLPAPAPSALTLEDDWRFLVPGAALEARDLADGKPRAWKAFDLADPTKHADEVHGDYWLKKTFRTRRLFSEPALVLGLVRGRHRVYLNGWYLGGADSFKPLRFFPFDRRLLSRSEDNTILVHVSAPKSFLPGIVNRNEPPPSIDEFGPIDAAVRADHLVNETLRMAYFPPALLMALGFFCAYLFRRTSRTALNLAVYAFVGALVLFYYNPVVTNWLDVPTFQFLKTFAMATSNMILLTVYLEIARKPRLELVNNALTLAMIAALTWGHLATVDDMAGQAALHQAVLYAISAYTAGWAALVGWQTAVELLRAKQRQISRSEALYGALAASFGLLSALVAMLAANPKIAARFVPGPARAVADQVGVAYPFLFACLVILVGFADWVVESREARGRKRREQFMLKASEVVLAAGSSRDKVLAIQAQFCEFVRAERSSIYVFARESTTELRSWSTVAAHEIKHRVSDVIVPKKGIIAHVCETNRPALVHDIAQDPRFERNEHAEHGRSYKTKSCMVLPIANGATVIGVITIADKAEDKSFSQEDFALAKMLVKDLGLLLGNLTTTEAAAAAAARAEAPRVEAPAGDKVVPLRPAS